MIAVRVFVWLAVMIVLSLAVMTDKVAREGWCPLGQDPDLCVTQATR